MAKEDSDIPGSDNTSAGDSGIPRWAIFLAVSPLWIILGVIIAVAILLCVPGLYEYKILSECQTDWILSNSAPHLDPNCLQRRLRQIITSIKSLCTRKCDPACCLRNKCDPACCLRTSDMDNPVYNPGNNHVTGNSEVVTNHNYDYSEIDMQKTQTFLPTTKSRKRYEDCVINRDSHTYSECSGELQPEAKGQPNRTSAPHNYVILEPGSNKRLAVRVVTEDIRDDPNHIYFRLEPGTNKVILQTQVDFEDIKDHTYFILETPAANAEAENPDEENAYAVNELSEHHYYVLEIE